jgi:hypothetical protein
LVPAGSESGGGNPWNRSRARPGSSLPELCARAGADAASIATAAQAMMPHLMGIIPKPLVARKQRTPFKTLMATTVRRNGRKPITPGMFPIRHSARFRKTMVRP